MHVQGSTEICACGCKWAPTKTPLTHVETPLCALIATIMLAVDARRLQLLVLGFSGPPVFGKCVCDVCHLQSWLALWQDDLFKSTFYLFHFVWHACLFVCVFVHLCAHGTSKVSSVREHLLLYLPQGQGFTVMTELQWMLTTFYVNTIPIHWATYRYDLPLSY